MKAITALALGVAALGCSHPNGSHSAADAQAIDGAAATGDATVAADAAGPWSRDWTKNPAVFQQTGATRLWGVSDVHGDRDRLVALLAAGGLTAGTATAPTWTGGTDTLVVNGDSIDKGAQSIEVLDYWMALIPQAAAAGGHVVVLAGNHEIEFLDDPANTKAATLDLEIGELLPAETPQIFADPDKDVHGRFLYERPIAALVDGWFFSHAGNSQGLSATAIAAKYRALVDQRAWGDPFFLDPDSIIEARSWWPSSGTQAFLDGYLNAIPARHIVFGHAPTTFDSSPNGDITVHSYGRLLLIDVGMSSAVDYSTGRLLRVDAPGTANQTVTMVDASGTSTPLSVTN